MTVTPTEAQELAETLPRVQPGSQIIAAIAACIGSIGKIAKDNLNQHQKYKFASIDDFLVATGKACSEHGLIVLQDEVSREVIQNKSASWLSFEFSFVVMHESGESFGPFRRSVAVPWHGAQSFGSAQSYALKQFMRSLFQIATGDQDDADYGPQATPPTLAKPLPPISTESIDLIYEFVDLLPMFPTRGIFEMWVRDFAQDVETMTEERGRRFLEWIKANQDPATWPSKATLALENAVEADRQERARNEGP